jgi:hypothetical protein
MTSPAEQIVVSTEPHLSQSIDQDKEHSPEVKPDPDVETHAQDPNSKKSFKRKSFLPPHEPSNERYRKLLQRYRDIRTQNERLHTSYTKASTISSQLSNETA